MLHVGDHVRDIKTNLPGKIISVHDVAAKGALAVIRLDKEDPLWGTLITAFEGEIDVLGHGCGPDVDSNPDDFTQKTLATRARTTGRETG